MEPVTKSSCHYEVTVMIVVFLFNCIFFSLCEILIIIYPYNVFDPFVIKKVKYVLFKKNKIKFFPLLLKNMSAIDA